MVCGVLPRQGCKLSLSSGLDGPSWASALPLTHVRPQISDHLVRQGHGEGGLRMQVEAETSLSKS